IVTLANATSPITDGVNGFASYEADVLRDRVAQLMDDPELAKQLGAKGRESVATKFPISRVVEHWREVIETAADQRVRKKQTTRASFDPGFPSVKLLLDYCQSPFATGQYFEHALRADHEVVSTGIRIPEALLREW